MIGRIPKEYSSKKHPETHEKNLRKSLAEKVSQYEESVDNPKDNFTELLIDGQKLRVAVEEITITGDLTGSFAKPSKDGGGLMPAENREFDLHTPLLYSSTDKSPRIDSAMNESNQNSRDYDDETDLDIDRIEDNNKLELESVDLVLEQGQQCQIDIVTEQGSQDRIDVMLERRSQSRDTHDGEDRRSHV